MEGCMGGWEANNVPGTGKRVVARPWDRGGGMGVGVGVKGWLGE
jgi:hypothetical protein